MGRGAEVTDFDPSAFRLQNFDVYDSESEARAPPQGKQLCSKIMNQVVKTVVITSNIFRREKLHEERTFRTNCSSLVSNITHSRKLISIIGYMY